jgi:hypothetical protein
MLEFLVTGLLSAASLTVPTLLWFSDRTKQSENRLDAMEKQLLLIELESKHTKEMIETRFSASLDVVSAELLELKLNVQAIHKRFDKLEGFATND